MTTVLVANCKLVRFYKAKLLWVKEQHAVRNSELRNSTHPVKSVHVQMGTTCCMLLGTDSSSKVKPLVHGNPVLAQPTPAKAGSKLQGQLTGLRPTRVEYKRRYLPLLLFIICPALIPAAKVEGVPLCFCDIPVAKLYLVGKGFW